MMVQRILGLEKLPRPKDAADAIAVAICHSWRGGAQAIVEVDRSQHGGAGMLPRAEGADLTPAQKLGQLQNVCRVDMVQSSLRDRLFKQMFERVLT